MGPGTTRRRFAALALLGCGLLIASAPALAAPSKDQQRAEARKAADAAMNKLYALRPDARALVEKAAGHAAFSNFGMKLMVAGGGKGEGVAVNHKTKRETFMRMVEVQARFGGVKEFQLGVDVRGARRVRQVRQCRVGAGNADHAGG
jgi:hypothetical protein